MSDKEALAREAASVLGNQAFRLAVAAVERGAIEEMLGAKDDIERRLAADHVKVVRGIVALLNQAITEAKQSVRPKLVV